MILFDLSRAYRLRVDELVKGTLERAEEDPCLLLSVTELYFPTGASPRAGQRLRALQRAAAEAGRHGQRHEGRRQESQEHLRSGRQTPTPGQSNNFFIPF